jgi:hypothetical protein
LGCGETSECRKHPPTTLLWRRRIVAARTISTKIARVTSAPPLAARAPTLSPTTPIRTYLGDTKHAIAGAVAVMTKANAITRLASLISLSIAMTALTTVFDVEPDISAARFLRCDEASLKTRADPAAHLQISLVEQLHAAHQPAGERYPLRSGNREVCIKQVICTATLRTACQREGGGTARCDAAPAPRKRGKSTSKSAPHCHLR